MSLGLRYVLITLGAFALTLIFTPLGIQIGERWGIVAQPGGRRRHTGAISRLGGIGIAGGFFGALALAQIDPIPTLDLNEPRRFWGLIAGGLFAFVVGILDDRYELPAWAQYAGYFASAAIAVAALIILQQFNNPFTNRLIELPFVLYLPLTLFWMTGMIVTVNWMDGLDGLAAGVAAILAATLSLHMIDMGQYSVVPQALALLGASAGFLVYNVSPARIFLGSSGAFLLGYLMGALGLIAGARVATVLLVMGVPIVDVAWTIIDRWRHGAPIFKGDRRHLHFRLLDAGLSMRTITFAYWGFCACFGALALLLSSRLYKLLVLGLLGWITLALLFYLSKERTP